MKNQPSSIATANRVHLFSLAFGMVAVAPAALASPVRAQTATTISLLPALTTYANLVPGPSGKLYGANEGNVPNPSLIFDSAGNLYGSTFEGGSGCSSLPGCGTVFRLSIRNGAWSESVIHAFTDQADGNSPVDGLVFDAKGNLYGGTQGADNLAQCNEFEFGACGQIFKLSPHAGGWEVTAEYPTPGWITPVGDLLVDASGSVYGSACDEYYFAGGAVFEIAP